MIIDPEMLGQPDVRAALAARDIGAVYRWLRKVGVSQRQIAQCTGQSQSEVSEILRGRQVRAYDVLVRIADGLGIPREYMGLSYGDSATYAEVTVTDPPEGDEDEMRRRAVILSAPVALWGQALFGKVPELPAPD